MHTLAGGQAHRGAGIGAAAGESRRWQRVLVFRSCRLPQFRGAVALVAAAHPGAEIWALTQARFADDVRSAGAHQVIPHPVARLGPAAIGLGLLRRLRALAFDAVVIPTMDETLSGSANLLRLAAAIGAPYAALSPKGQSCHVVDRRRLRRLAVSQTVRISEPVVVLWHMARALMTPRRRPRASPDRIRVLHIINSLGLGGAQTQCAELVNRTPADRYEASVLVLSDDGQFSRDRFVRADVPVAFLDRRAATGTPIAAIADHCRKGRYDVVHTWLPLPNMYGAAAARLAGVPRVVTAIRSENPGRFAWCQWWFRAADVMASRLADAVTVNASPLVADHARWAAFPARRISVVHNGLDPARLGSAGEVPRTRLRAALELPAGATVVGIVGRLSPEKDQATFLRIVQGLVRRGHAVHAVVVGDGPCEPDLRALTASLALTPIVRFMGARQDATTLIAGLDALVLTSWSEGFPNVLLEAAMLGVPVASTAVGGVLDIITHPDSLFAPGDAAAGTLALERLLTDRAWAGQNATHLRRRCLEQFSADRMVAAWLRLYEPAEAAAGPRYQCARPDAAAWCTLAQGDRR